MVITGLSERPPKNMVAGVLAAVKRFWSIPVTSSECSSYTVNPVIDISMYFFETLRFSFLRSGSTASGSGANTTAAVLHENFIDENFC